MLTLIALLLEATLVLDAPALTTSTYNTASAQAITNNEPPVDPGIGSGGWHDDD